MGKFLKYEIKESSKTFMYIILGNIIASLILAFTIGNGFREGMNNVSEFNTFAFSISTLAAFSLSIATFVGLIFAIVGSYRKDLYTDSAYLKFALPINGAQFFNAKIINMFFWSLINIFITLAVNILVYTIVFRDYLNLIIESINFNINILSIIILLLMAGISYIQTLIFVYFCITFVKAIFKNSKNGYIWFLFYLGISFIHGIINNIVMKFAPYYLSLGSTISIEKYSFNLSHIPFTGFIDSNIAVFTLGLIITAIFYVASIQMLNKKIDI